MRFLRILLPAALVLGSPFLTEASRWNPYAPVSLQGYGAIPVAIDSNGNRLSQIETNAGRTEETTYTYDPVNRLATVTYPDRAVEYTYDLAGNRTRELTTGAEASDKAFHYDAINRLENITDTATGAELTGYTYDANGNTTSKTAGGVTTTFHFDIRDQLGEVQQGASILGRYGYDYDGRRILKIGADGRRHYTYDQLSVITEADETNTTVSKYDYGLDQLVSLGNRTEGRSFFHLDILGSTVSLTEATGSTRQSIFYDAWGIERDRIGASSNRFTFTGQEIDRETGLYYFKARFYDPDIGRFLNQDSVFGDVNSPPSLHRYAYANANPLVFVDPTGNLSVRDLSPAALFATAGRRIQEFNVGTSVLPNFGVQFFGQALQLPEQLSEGIVSLVTPSGLEALGGDVPTAPLPTSRVKQAQFAAFKEAANPETNFFRRGLLAGSAVLSQPAVIIEEGLINPILAVPEQAEKVGVHVSQAIDAGNSVERAVHVAEATKEFAGAFVTLGGVAAGVQGLASASSSKIGQFRNLTPEGGGSFFDIPGPAPRGVAIEEALARNAPKSLPTPPTFRVVDRVDPGGVVTSVKSIDLTLPSARNVSTLGSKLRGQIDKVAEFQGASQRTFRVRGQDIQGRALDVVIQKGKATAQQTGVLQEVVELGAQRGVKVNIVEIP